jgi:hypothetical protein
METAAGARPISTERPLPELANDDGSVLIDKISATMASLVRHRVFDPDVRYQNKHNG